MAGTLRFARPMGATISLIVRLGELLRRDCDGHLAWLRLHKIRQSEHRPVGEPAQKSEYHQKTDQARHCGKLLRAPPAAIGCLPRNCIEERIEGTHRSTE